MRLLKQFKYYQINGKKIVLYNLRWKINKNVN